MTGGVLTECSKTILARRDNLDVKYVVAIQKSESENVEIFKYTQLELLTNNCIINWSEMHCGVISNCM